MFARLKKLMLVLERLHPLTVTAIQSTVVVILASVMAAAWHHYVGRYLNTYSEAVLAALVIAGILSPIFLYPSFHAAHRLRQANKKIQAQAYTDYLTGLPNFFALSEEIERRMSMSGKQSLAVHFLDLERFKEVNDALGHDIGNELLVEVAKKLRRAVPDDIFVARFGGDEFVVLQPLDGSITEAQALVASLRETVTGSYNIATPPIRVHVTIGTALAPLHARDARSLLKAADMALYHAKRRGLPAALFTPELAKNANQNWELESRLYAALDRTEFFLAYQPIVDAKDTRQIQSVEALLRWRLSDGRVIMPSEFICAAERSGMIVEIGEWTLRQACSDCLKWPKEIGVSVNVSPVQFSRSDFVDVVRSALRESGLSAHRLTLEITETILISDAKFASQAFDALRRIGVQLALDDFGTGFSGLSYLRDFNINKIKVDKSIIDHACDDLKSFNILIGAARIARQSMMEVIVEGVDSRAKEDLIRSRSAATGLQGYLYFEPMPVADLHLLLESSADGKVQCKSRIRKSKLRPPRG